MRKGTLSNPEGPHLGEANFRRFERIFERFLSIHPGVFSFTPSDVAPSTCVARLRDAANAIIVNGWLCSFDLVRFREIWPTVQVIRRGDLVLIGTKQALRTPEETKALIEGTPPPHTIPHPTSADLLALFQLLSSGAIEGPISITDHPADIVAPYGHHAERTSESTWLIL